MGIVIDKNQNIQTRVTIIRVIVIETFFVFVSNSRVLNVDDYDWSVHIRYRYIIIYSII